MKKNFADTLKKLRLSAGFTQKQVYEMIGVPQSTFSSWEVGKAEPSADILLKLCEIYAVTDVLSAFGYDGYNEDGTLQLNLKEQELIEKYRFIAEHSSEGINTVNYILNREYKIAEQQKEAAAFSQRPNTRIVQYYQKLASAGSGQVVFDDVAVDWIEIPDVPEYKRVAYAIGVNGQSMEPLYYDGDVLLVELTCQIKVGEIGIFIVGNEAYVKKLGEKELISLNEEYRNIPLTEDSKCMGKVVGRLE